ncbi:MAG: AAA family ATPase [Anaerolineae bacterium]|nr:AAA family ATPase [Anaerolineae bacterium]
MSEQEQLEQAIETLLSQREVLGDAAVEAALAGLRRRLDQLERQRLESASNFAGERRQVTVMFADISGFTALAETLDPEVARDLLNACFEQLVPIVEKYGGTVDKFIGDAVMALFGAPVAHEDDPERALRSALEIRETLHDFNTARSTTFDIHFGINTGLVIAGAIGSSEQQEYSVIGSAVNLASRLEDLAQEGEILVGPDTYRLAAPEFQFEDLGLVPVKGKEEPVRVYRLLAVRAHRGRTGRGAGLISSLVGRQDELARLAQGIDRVRNGVGGVITVVGEAGLGKSRLVAEACSRLKRESPGVPVRWVEGRCLSYGSSIAYLFWLDLLRELLGVSPEDQPAHVQQKLQEELERLDERATGAVYPYLARLLSLSLDAPGNGSKRLVGEELKQGVFYGMTVLLEGLARQEPLVVVAEDLHWADPTSLELLERMLALVERMPLLFILVLRPQTDHGCWKVRELAQQTYGHLYTDLSLSPLSASDSQDLVERLLDAHELPQQLEERILRRAEGNPFYVEELVRSLIFNGLLVQDREGSWRTTQPINHIAIPDTLQGVLMARIDRLEEDTKRTLQIASVIGRAFLYRILAAIAQEELRLDEHILTLREEELIRERARAPELEYIFKHHLTWEAAYSGLLRQERRIFHRQVGEALERIFPDRREAHLDLLAYHWERAGVPEKAIDYLLQAGDRARLIYAHQEAIDYYRRGLAVLKAEGRDEQAARTLMKLGLTYYTAFDFRQARQAYDEGIALWEQVGTRKPVVLPPAPHALRTRLVEPATLDPGFLSDSFSVTIADQLFGGLLEISSEMDLVPYVARSWEVTDEGRRYVFHLRDDVVWSDGVPVTAHDFVFAWLRIIDPARGSPMADLMYDVEGARAFRRGETKDRDRVGVRAPDDGTLEVELEAPSAYFPYLMSYSAFYPVPQHIVTVHGEGWGAEDCIVGNGPFLLRSWERGRSIELVRNPDYAGLYEGNVERVAISLVADWPSILSLYQADELDVVDLWGLTMDRMDRARQRYPTEYITQAAPMTIHVRLNADQPPIDDRRVRRALAFAVDKEVLTNQVMGDFAAPARGGFVPPGIPGYTAGIGLPYDLAQARSLLAEAGYPGGRGFPRLAMIGPDRPMFVHISELLEASWKEGLGIDVEWAVMEWAELRTQLDRRLPHLFLVAWEADYFDPHSFLRTGLQSHDIRWRDKAYEELVEAARRTVVREERMALYQQVDRMLMEDAATIPLVYPRNHFLIKPWVRRFPISAIRYWFWKDVVIEPHF